MDWLKNKKNLPIIAGLATFVLVGAAVFILFQVGIIGGSPAPAPTPVMPVPVSQTMPGGPPRPGIPLNGQPKPQRVAMAHHAPVPHPAMNKAPVASAPKVAADPTIINPKVGPDPFGIPGGIQKLKAIKAAAHPFGLAMPLNEILPRPQLWTYQAPQPPAPPAPVGPVDVAAPTMRVSAIVNGPDGVYAILEVQGTSQNVKAGDTIPGGTVSSIQSDGVTVRTAGGQTVTVPLTGNATGPAGTSPATDQSQPGDQSQMMDPSQN